MEEYYITRLRSDSTEVQRNAAEALADMGSARAIPNLLVAEMTASERRGAFAVGPNESFLLQALRKICIVRGAATLPALKVALEDHSTRIIAVNMLSELQGEAVPELVGALHNYDPVIREQVCMALACIGPAARTAVDDLLKILKYDRDREVRSRAAQALGCIKHRSEAIVSALREYIATISETAPQLCRKRAVAALEALDSGVDNVRGTSSSPR